MARVTCRLPGKLLRDSGPRVSTGTGRAGTCCLTRSLKRLPGSKSRTPAGGPSIPLRVDSIYLRENPIPQAKGSAPQAASTLGPVPCRLTRAARWLRVRGAQDPFLPFVNMPEQLTELGKTHVLTR